MLNGSGLLLLRLFNVKPGGHRHVHSPEELDLLIAESQEAGVLASEQQHRLHQALTMGERTAGDLMVPRKRIAGIDVRTAPDEAVRWAIASPYTRLPVYDGSLDKVLGIIHTKDLANHFALHGTPPPLRELLRPLPTVRRGVKMNQLLALLREQRATQALVVGRGGKVEGLVSLEDVLEELLGRMAGTPTAPELQSDGDGHLIVAGIRRLDEVGKHLGLELSHGEVDTVSGLVLAKLGRPPRVGDVVDYGAVHLEVTAVEGRGVKECRIEHRPPPDTAEAGEGATPG